MSARLFLIAPSGTGKSHFVKTKHHQYKGFELIDVDHYEPVRLMYAAFQNQYGNRWWDAPGVSEAKRAALLTMAGSVPTGRIIYLTSEAHLAAEATKIGLVMPTPFELMSNQQKRNNPSQPIFDWEQNRALISKINGRVFDLVAQKGIPMLAFSTIECAVAWLIERYDNE